MSTFSPLNSTITSITRSRTRLPYPFVASIQINSKGKYQHLCGATILHAQFVLTVAHCFKKYTELKAKDYFVAAGSNKLFDEQAKRVRVSSITKYIDFDVRYGYDIALIKLETPMPLDNTRFASLDFKDDTRKGGDVNVLLLGWGHTQPSVPKNLETVPFRTITDIQCFLEHKFKYLTGSEICAINTGGPRGACDVRAWILDTHM